MRPAGTVPVVRITAVPLPTACSARVQKAATRPRARAAVAGAAETVRPVRRTSAASRARKRT